MMIYGLSQSSGVERRLTVERGGQGVVLTITDHIGDKERDAAAGRAAGIAAAVVPAGELERAIERWLARGQAHISAE